MSGRGTGTPASPSSNCQLHLVLRRYFLSPSDRLGPSGTPSLDEETLDTSEWDGELVLTLHEQSLEQGLVWATCMLMASH